MRGRRLWLVALITTALTVGPASGVSASQCSSIEGNAVFDISDASGIANVAYQGERLRVHFTWIGFTPTGEYTADIDYLWEFPQGVVYLVEHSTTTPVGGPANEFNSEIDVFDGEGSQWTWSGAASLASNRALFRNISGELCLGD